MFLKYIYLFTVTSAVLFVPSIGCLKSYQSTGHHLTLSESERWWCVNKHVYVPNNNYTSPSFWLWQTLHTKMLKKGARIWWKNTQYSSTCHALFQAPVCSGLFIQKVIPHPGLGPSPVHVPSVSSQCLVCAVGVMMPWSAKVLWAPAQSLTDARLQFCFSGQFLA